MRANKISWVVRIAILAATTAPALASCGGDRTADAASGSGVASASTGANGSGGSGGIGAGGGFEITTGGGTTPETKCSPAPPLDGISPGPAPDGAIADFALPGSVVRLAIGSDGSAVVAAVDFREISVRRYVGGQWEGVERIARTSDIGSGFGEGSLAVAAGTSGRVLVVYAEGILDQFAICARTFDPGSGWSDPELLGISNEGWWQEPSHPNPAAAMNGKGNAVVVWSGDPDNTNGVFARRFAPGSGFGELETLTKYWGPAATLALHEDDRAVVAWLRAQASVVESRALDPVLGWGAVEQLAQNAGFPQVSVGLAGSTVAVWTRDDNGEDVVETAVLSPAGMWSASEKLDSGSDFILRPRVSATAGFGIGGWSSWPTNMNCYSEANVRILGADGLWQPETPVPKLNDAPATIVSLSANNAGKAVVAWERYDTVSCNGNGKGMSLSWFDAATAVWSYEELDPSVSTWSTEVALTPDSRALVGWNHADSILVRWADPPAAP